MDQRTQSRLEAAAWTALRGSSLRCRHDISIPILVPVSSAIPVPLRCETPLPERGRCELADAIPDEIMLALARVRAKELDMFYELWSLTPPTLPARSRLSSLAPMGIGSALVESVTSYMMRLAEAHSVVLAL